MILFIFLTDVVLMCLSILVNTRATSVIFCVLMSYATGFWFDYFIGDEDEN